MVGLALQGGGAKGAYEAGAVRALSEHGITFDVVVGTSIGAINGAIIASGGVDKLYDIWSNVSMDIVFDLNDPATTKLLTADHSRASFIRESLRTVRDNGLDVSRGMEYLTSIIDEQELRRSPIDYGLVTVSLTNKKPLELMKSDIPDGQLLDYVFASANFPLFKRKKIDNESFIDGGFYNNFPINMLEKIGCTQIYGISLGATIAPCGRVSEGCTIPTTIITPSEKLGMVLDFRNSTCERYLRLGYLDTKQRLLGWPLGAYYVRRESDEYAYNLLLKNDLEVLTEVARGLQTEGMIMPTEKHLVLHEIFAYLTGLFRLQPTQYFDAVAMAVFDVASDYGVDRLSERSLEQLVMDTAQVIDSGAKAGWSDRAYAVLFKKREQLFDDIFDLAYMALANKDKGVL